MATRRQSRRRMSTAVRRHPMPNPFLATAMAGGSWPFPLFLFPNLEGNLKFRCLAHPRCVSSQDMYRKTSPSLRIRYKIRNPRPRTRQNLPSGEGSKQTWEEYIVSKDNKRSKSRKVKPTELQMRHEVDRPFFDLSHRSLNSIRRLSRHSPRY